MASPTGPAKNHIWQGRKVSLLEMERIVGISDDVLGRRIKAGATLEQAVAMGVEPPPQKHEFRGELLTIEDISRKTGVRAGTIWSRFKRGVPLEEAVSAPKGKQLTKLSEIECQNPNCKMVFLGSPTKKYCSRRCCGEVYAMKSGKNEYFDFEGKRLNKFQISKITGVSVFTINRRVKHYGATVPEAASPSFEVPCKYCGVGFQPGVANKSGFCSKTCTNLYCEESAGYSEKHCIGCGYLYKPASRAQNYCTKNCRQVNFHRKKETADDQYARINGDWRRYFQRLVNQKGRNELTADILVEIAESQEYKCALSGISMQCHLKKGVKNPYNASIDRIEAGGSYSKDNIRLTCAAVNKWRGELETDCFIEFCRAVADFNPRKESI